VRRFSWGEAFCPVPANLPAVAQCHRGISVNLVVEAARTLRCDSLDLLSLLTPWQQFWSWLTQKFAVTSLGKGSRLKVLKDGLVDLQLS